MTKLRSVLVSLMLAGSVCNPVLAAVQTVPPPAVTTVPPPAAAPRAQFFAGTIVELDATHVKVSRTLVGHPTESRSFAVTPATKMNKATIKLRGRVTVRYKHLPEGGDVALEIQPRPVTTHPPKM